MRPCGAHASESCQHSHRYVLRGSKLSSRSCFHQRMYQSNRQGDFAILFPPKLSSHPILMYR
jgi:hypothetical protein